MAGPIVISVLADTRRATAGIGSLTQSVAGAGRKIASGLAVGAGALVALGASAVESASKAQQSLGATQTVYGKYADTVIKRSNEAATAIGVSANEYRELSNVLGASLSGAGVPLKKVTELTGDLNTRAADMAATFGGTTKEAIEAVGSLLRGEADPIERYGVSIKASDVSARLAAKGLDGLTGAALKQAEIQERVALVMEKTRSVQGAFGRESGTLANQQQVLAAQVENLKAKLGTALLPILTKIGMFLNQTVLPAVGKFAAEMRDKLGPIVTRIGEAFRSLLEKLQPVADWLRENPEAVKGAAIALGVAATAAVALAVGMGAVALATSPLTLTIVAVAAVGAALGLAYKRSETFRNAVNAVGQFIRGSVLPALQQFGAYLVNTVVPAVVKVAQDIGQRLRPILVQMVATFRQDVAPAVAQAVAKFREMWPTIKRVIEFVARMYGEFLKFAAGVAGKVIPVVIKIAGFLVSTLIPTISSVVSNVKTVIRAFTDFTNKLIAIGGALNDFENKVKNKVGEVVRTIMELPGRAQSALGDLGSKLAGAGRALIQGLIDGINEKIGEVTSTLRNLTDKLPDWKGPRERDRVLLKPAGRLIMRGLVDGIRDGSGGVQKALERVTALITKTISKRIKDDKKAGAAIAARLKSMKDEYRQLTRNGKAQDRNAAALAAAAGRLKQLKDDAAAYAKSIKDSFVSYGSVVGLGQVDDGSVSTSGLIDQLRDRLARAQRFAALVKQLAGKLNPTSLQQLIDAGVDGGLATAEAIAAGGSSAIATINDLTTQIGASGGALGQAMSKQFKSAGIQAAASVVAELKKRQRELDRIAERIGELIVRQVKKALGIQGGGNNARTAAAGGGGSQTLEIKLSGQQQSALQQGKSFTATVDVGRAAGVRRLAIGGAV